MMQFAPRDALPHQSNGSPPPELSWQAGTGGRRKLAGWKEKAQPLTSADDERGDNMARPNTEEVRHRRARARGAVMTEYTVLVGLVAIACIGAFVGLGVALVSNFEARRDLIFFPSP